jgi:hypothetical protein
MTAVILPASAADSTTCPDGRSLTEHQCDRFLLVFLMPRLIKERIKKLREEIAEISKENILRGQAKKNTPAASDQQRRVQRLQEILDELLSLTDWKKP